eukprot:TRINITY_DN23496_c0_g1_i1.p1 TRINITY_DN23496_c0_g1~~TRINITY_DN23496_c0_g1_i1.p1  ORF type:complete len:600 (-),score=128.42 TRINITY_DN23496_c0_g1_i1:183-1982(-)
MAETSAHAERVGGSQRERASLKSGVAQRRLRLQSQLHGYSELKQDGVNGSAYAPSYQILADDNIVRRTSVNGALSSGGLDLRRESLQSVRRLEAAGPSSSHWVASRPGPHIDEGEMHEFSIRGSGSWEDYVLRRWTTERCNDASSGSRPRSRRSSGEIQGVVFPEYKGAARLICLHRSLLVESQMWRTLSYLGRQQSGSSGGLSKFRGSATDVVLDFHDLFEPTLLLVLKKAFGLRTDSAAWNEGRAIPILADFDGNFFDAAITMWGALPLWKKPVMSAALRELLVTEDATGLQVVLGMIKASTLACNAGKVDVWTRMLQRVGERIPKSPTATLETLEETANEENAGHDHDEAKRKRRRAARSRLWDEALAFADEWKEKALATVFLEPTKMYFAACQEQELLDNVDVHGSSVYMAVLLSTLGVRCPRQPFMLDTPISCVSFLDALQAEQLKALWRPENLGKPWTSVPECREEPRVSCTVANHYSNFLFNGRQPWQIANGAVQPDCLEERRQKLQPYLEQFARYFSQDIILVPLTQRLLDREDCRADLQVLLEDLAEKDPQGTGEDCEDVRFWLWDLDVFPARIREDRAVMLLQHAGLLK